MTRLPPLNALRVFEVAARHLSFTRAAAELHVTHGAVSRQITALEEHLQAPLFKRGSRSLQLTTDGRRLERAVSAAFDTLRTAAAQITPQPDSVLRVSAPPTLSMWWLIPRMIALHHAHPQLRIELSTGTAPADFEGDPYDAAIRRIAGVPKGLVAERFLDGRSIPVCSPAYRREQRLRSVSDLARATLVMTRSEPLAWDDWLRLHHVRREPLATMLEFEQLYFAVQAALDSLGVALVPAALVAAEVSRGRLHALSQPEGRMLPTYALLSPRVSAKREAIHTLGEWLKSAA